MKKALKTIFSPRKFILWVFVFIIAFSVPEFNKPSMSQTSAIVSNMAVDFNQGKINVAMSVYTPAQGQSAEQQVFVGEGINMADAINSVSLALGKEIGLAQCQIIAVGENLADNGLTKILDYLIRDRRVGRNTLLVMFTGEADDFVQSLTDMSKTKALKLDNILNFDKRFMLTQKSTIESFYRGFYSTPSQSIMPKIQIVNEATYNAIEVSSCGGSGGGSGGATGNSTQGDAQSSGTSSKKYMLNDGSMAVFKKGKRLLDLNKEQMKKINFYVNKNQRGSLTVSGVSDNTYNDATVVLEIENKDIKLKTMFENDKPVVSADVKLTVYIDQIIEQDVNNKLTYRTQELYTTKLREKINEKVKQDMLEIAEFCKQNKIDIFELHKMFDAKHHKKFKQYLKSTTEEDYLNGIEFKVKVKAVNEF